MQKVIDHLFAAGHELIKTVVPTVYDNFVEPKPLTASTENVVFENEHVRITRVSIPPGVTHVPSEPERMKRVVVNLNENVKNHATTSNNHTVRHNSETVNRQLGEVVWKEASSHVVTNVGTVLSDSLIIELKN